MLYSYPDDLVLDLFLGSGQTIKVARWLGRCFVGYDIVEKYVELARARLNEPLMVRSQQLVAVFGKVALDQPAGESGPDLISNYRTSVSGSRLEYADYSFSA